MRKILEMVRPPVRTHVWTLVELSFWTPPGHRLPTGFSALVGQILEVTSEVRGRDRTPSHPQGQQLKNRVVIYLFIPHSFLASPMLSRVGGRREPWNPDGPDPALLPDQAGLQCPCGAWSHLGLRWAPVRCQFLARGRRQRKESSSKGLRDTSEETSTTRLTPKTTSSLLVNL